jgi:hypothetical protein
MSDRLRRKGEHYYMLYQMGFALVI